VGIWCRIQAGHAGGTLHNVPGWPRASASEGGGVGMLRQMLFGLVCLHRYSTKQQYLLRSEYC
jgi:hypothetical protein